MSDALRVTYAWPNRIFSRDVPGWRGFKTWYFECEHENPMNKFIFDDNNSFFKFLKKPDFDGQYFALPLKFSLGSK